MERNGTPLKRFVSDPRLLSPPLPSRIRSPSFFALMGVRTVSHRFAPMDSEGEDAREKSFRFSARLCSEDADA